MKTADLIDRHASHLTLVHLPFRQVRDETILQGADPDNKML